jgi:hypothetical protein
MILAYPGFQRNGAFDQRTYEKTLRSNKMTPDEFDNAEDADRYEVEDLIGAGWCPIRESMTSIGCRTKR